MINRTAVPCDVATHDRQLESISTSRKMAGRHDERTELVADSLAGDYDADTAAAAALGRR